MGNHRQQFRHFIVKLEREDDEVILKAMMPLFFEGYDYIIQHMAGGFLWKIKPDYKRDLYRDIKSSLAHWDYSVEELPIYLAETCGYVEVKTVLEQLEKTQLTEREERALTTYNYWLKSKSVVDDLNAGWSSYFGF